MVEGAEGAGGAGQGRVIGIVFFFWWGFRTFFLLFRHKTLAAEQDGAEDVFN